MKTKSKKSPVSSSRVFASRFLKKSASVQVPLGRYDPKAQVYVHAKTGKPIFAVGIAAKTGKKKQLSDQELDNLLKSGRFVDMLQLEKLQTFGAWCSVSDLTTLSTTTCCPIVTDTESDVGCDDTPSSR